MANRLISKSKVEKLLRDFKVDEVGMVKGFKIWMKDDVVIRIPKGYSIEWELFYEIAHEQLDISDWDIDLWCGENNC